MMAPYENSQLVTTVKSVSFRTDRYQFLRREIFRAFRDLVIVGIGFSFIACTDGRTPIPRVALRIDSNLPEQSLFEVAQVKFNNQEVRSWNQVRQGNSLYLTGTPFGFSRWDIGANPENPQLVFSVSNQIDRLQQKWVAPWYASGGLAIFGTTAVMSGSVGASVMDLRETNRPREVLRYPPYNESSDDVIADEAFIWSAATFHPSQPYLYAFRQQDFAFTYALGSGGLSLISKQSYGASGEISCCVDSTVTFNNQLYLAFRSRLLFFDFNGPNLANAREYTGLQATGLATSDNFLYVLHRPTASWNSRGPLPPAGIYVFDKQGQHVGYLQANPNRFSVNANDSHLYADEDTGAIKIYRILWSR